MKLLLYILLLSACGVVQAAKVTVEVITPTENEPYTDAQGVEHPSTPLTNLATIVFEWGTCNGTEFGLRQSAIAVSTTQIGVKIVSAVYPTGLSRVCVRAFAVNSDGGMSRSSNVAFKDLLPSTGKPVTLGQPIILNFVQPDQELL